MTRSFPHNAFLMCVAAIPLAVLAWAVQHGGVKAGVALGLLFSCVALVANVVGYNAAWRHHEACIAVFVEEVNRLRRKCGEPELPPPKEVEL